MNRERLMRSFEIFAEDCKDSSPLYEFLCKEIMKDDELLELCFFIQKGQPAPNMLLGAIHHLLLNGKSHPLAQFYSSMTTEPKEGVESFRLFKDFSRKYRDNIIHLLQTKLVQTNEVRRSAYLYPTFAHIYSQMKQPLALIEIGTSAGLQLLWDQYRYSYGTDKSYGNLTSSVHISAQINGDKKPYLPTMSPPVSHRIGVDLHINDVSDREDYLWLLSLIWPEHHERRKLFEQAVQTAQRHKLQLIEGDGIQLLTKIARKIPETSTLCIFHTHVANQLSNDQKHMLIAKIQEIGRERNVFHLYNNMWDADLHLDAIVDRSMSEQVVGQTNSHGRWFTWNLTAE